MIDDYIRKWIIKADNDFKVAEHELAQPDIEMVTDAICFHCQQSVEKLLKAYLASKNIDFGKTHNPRWFYISLYQYNKLRSIREFSGTTML